MEWSPDFWFYNYKVTGKVGLNCGNQSPCWVAAQESGWSV
jgi:hypothetical protein